MKCRILITIFLASLSGILPADEPAPTMDVAHIAEFIGSLPTREQMTQDKEVVIHYPPNESADAKQKRIEARERLEKAMASYDRLYKQLRVGASVFDYPGLLALSRDQKVDDNGAYRINFGTSLIRGPKEKFFASEFDVYCDKTGTITRVKKIVWDFL